MNNFLLPLFLFFLLFFIAIPARNINANLGVGVGTGQIVVDEVLRPGIVYQLPGITVINTGSIASNYGVTTEFRENQPEKKFDRSWISYDPSSFYLEPGDVQHVRITLNIPVRTEPGDYFAFLSAHPDKVSDSGVTTVGVAAASKLYFTIEPANTLEGIYFRIKSIWINNQPWTNILAGAVVIFALISILRRYINVDINIGKKRSNENTKDKTEK